MREESDTFCETQGGVTRAASPVPSLDDLRIVVQMWPPNRFLMNQTPTQGQRDFQSLPRDYAALCRDVWLPRPIRDRAEHDLALNALAPIWRHEAEMSADQAAWFSLVTDLVNRWEEVQPEIVAARVAHEQHHSADENKDVPSPADEILEREWEVASPDELRALLKDTHTLLTKARGLIAKQRSQLEQQEADIEELLKPRKIPRLSKEVRARIKTDAETAMAELRAAGFFCFPNETGIDAQFAKRLRGLLEAHKMTEADFARLLELDEEIGREIIEGKRHLAPVLISKLSAHFALPAEYLL